MRLTLGQFVGGAAAIVLLILCIGGWRLEVRARRQLASTAKARQERVAGRTRERVKSEIGRAQTALEGFERQSTTSSFSLEDEHDLERALFARLFDDPRLDEVAFTSPQFQVALVRGAKDAITTRIIRSGTLFVRERDERNVFDAAPLLPQGAANDPTKDYTYTVPLEKEYEGTAIWSDLHRSELDPHKIVLSVQKALRLNGSVLGVMRVSIDTQELDKISRDADDPVFLLSTGGNGVQLVARTHDDDEMKVVDGDVRFVARNPSPELSALLMNPELKKLDPKKPEGGGKIRVNGATWLFTIQPIDLGRGGTEGWMAAVVFPEAR